MSLWVGAGLLTERLMGTVLSREDYQEAAASAMTFSISCLERTGQPQCPGTQQWRVSVRPYGARASAYYSWQAP